MILEENATAALRLALGNSWRPDISPTEMMTVILTVDAYGIPLSDVSDSYELHPYGLVCQQFVRNRNGKRTFRTGTGHIRKRARYLPDPRYAARRGETR